jgi:hypothetical protein
VEVAVVPELVAPPLDGFGLGFGVCISPTGVESTRERTTHQV